MCWIPCKGRVVLFFPGSEEPFADRHGEQIENQNGEYHGGIPLYPSGEAQALSGIGFRQKILPFPSRVPAAEQDDQDGSQRQTDVADEPVFEVQDGTGPSQRVDVFPEVESEDAGDGSHRCDEEIHPDCFFPGEVPLIHHEGDQIFKNGHDRCDARNAQKQEENHARDPSARQVIEDPRQRNEGQSGPAG